MYERTIPFYTFSKTYAMTGLRLGYVAVKDPAIRERMRRCCSTPSSNVTSVVQYGGIDALEGSQECVEAFRTELQARRDLFYAGIEEHAAACPERSAAAWRVLCVPQDRSRRGGPLDGGQPESISWSMAQELIARGTDWLRAWRGLRRQRGRLRALLLRARSGRAGRRAGVDGRAVRQRVAHLIQEVVEVDGLVDDGDVRDSP